MTSNPPHEDLIPKAWYVSETTGWFHQWNGGHGVSTPHHWERIQPWAAVNWDDPPEYVMAPEDSPPGDRYPFCGVFSTGGHDNWGDMHKAQVYSFAVYTRHPDRPEVLRRVWLRDDAPSHVEKCAQPVPISSVDWSAVHAGKVVPPSMVEVPEWDMDGSCAADGWDVAMLQRDGGLDFRRLAGVHRVTWAPYIAAHYTINGHLLGHRTADRRWSGWRDVSEKARMVTAAGERPAAPTNPGEVTSVSGVTHSDARGLAKPDIRAIMQDQARHSALVEALDLVTGALAHSITTMDWAQKALGGKLPHTGDTYMRRAEDALQVGRTALDAIQQGET